MKVNYIHEGDCIAILQKIPDHSVHCIITSPPYYGLRDYGVAGQLGQEDTLDEYLEHLITVFRECKRALRADGTLWLNIGDTYAGSGRAGKNPENHKMFGKTGWNPSLLSKPQPIPNGYKRKDLLGIPWRLALALQQDGWYLRQDIIWAKGTSGLQREGNVMPESVRDRCTRAHEYIFLLSKSPSYFFDAEAIKEPGKYAVAGNRRSVWRANPSQFRGSHFATFPQALIEPCIRAGCPKGGIVLDPFIGSGTTAVVAAQEGRNYIGIELNSEYVAMAKERIALLKV